MAQWLRARATVPEKLSLGSATMTSSLCPPIIPAPGELQLCPLLLAFVGICTHMQTYRDTYMNIK